MMLLLQPTVIDNGSLNGINANTVTQKRKYSLHKLLTRKWGPMSAD